jgi:hypothetical protein
MKALSSDGLKEAIIALVSRNGLEALEAHSQSVPVRMVLYPARQANIPTVQLFQCI